MNTNSYRKHGGAAGARGSDYQINVLTMVLLNGLEKIKNWRLSTEDKDAAKFDDLIFEILLSKSTILLQAKYSKNTETKVKFEDLMSSNHRNHFGLPKYFCSYQEIKNKFQIQDIVICTNLGLDESAKEHLMKESIGETNVLHFKGAPNIGYRFKVWRETSLKQDIEKYVKKYNPNVDITDRDIDEFLKHLLVLPNYLDDKSLDDIIEATTNSAKLSVNMHKSSSVRMDNKTIFKNVHDKMSHWFRNDRGRHLTEVEAKGFFYDIISKKYCDSLTLYDVSFKKENLPLVFQTQQRSSNNHKKISHIIPGNEHNILNVVKIYQAVQEAKIKALFVNPGEKIDIQLSIIDAFKVKSYTTLVIVCHQINGNDATEMCNKVMEIFEAFDYKHVILIAEEHNELAIRMKQATDLYEAVADIITFTDLDEEVQREFRHMKYINFQGSMVSLDDLFTSWTNDDLKQIANPKVLERFARHLEIEVGLRLKALDKYYVDRSFNRDGHNIHEENICLKCETTEEKLILIADSAGMGKSTVLTSLEHSIKKKYPHLWVVRFDLESYLEIMRKTSKERKRLSIKDLLNSREITRLQTELDEKLFAAPKRVVLILDGVDEVSPTYTDLVKSLLKDSMEQENVAKIFVTARPHLFKQFEEFIKIKPFTLEPFSEQNQIDFLKKFWMKQLGLGDDKSTEKCERYAKALIEKTSKWIDDRSINSFAGIPLQTRMLAEVFQDGGSGGSEDWEGCKAFILSNHQQPKLPMKTNIIQLYKMFIDKKQDLFITRCGTIVAETALENIFQECNRFHQALALKVIFGSDIFNMFTSYTCPDKSMFENHDLLRVGIVQLQGDEICFIHRTFAEYFVAQCLMTEIERGTLRQTFREFFINQIMLKDHFNVIRALFDGLTQEASGKLRTAIESLFVCVADKIINEKASYLHVFAQEGCAAILDVTIDCMRSRSPGISVDVEDDSRSSPLYKAARFGYLNATKCLVVKGADVDKKNTQGKTAVAIAAAIKNNLEIVKFLVDEAKADVKIKDDYGRTPLCMAAFRGNEKIVEFLVNNSGPDPIAKRIDGQTALYPAVYIGNFDIVNFLVAQVQVNVNLRYEEGKTALHTAAERGSVDIVRLLVKTDKTLVDKIDDDGQTALHVAASEGKLEVVKVLVDEANANMDIRDKDGHTPLDLAYRHLDVELFLLR